jgi:branched-chain amino acid aminotransferase
MIKGVTRNIVLEAAKKLLPIEMRPIQQRELKFCEEAFLTSSTKDLTPVIEIDGHKIGSGNPGKFTQLLREHFIKLRHQELTDQ